MKIIRCVVGGIIAGSVIFLLCYGANKEYPPFWAVMMFSFLYPAILHTQKE